MPQYLFKNEKGLFGQLTPKALMTVEGVENLEKWISLSDSGLSPPSSFKRFRPLNKEDQEALQKFLNVIKQFEVQEAQAYPVKRHDSFKVKTFSSDSFVDAYCWIKKEGGFSSNRTENDLSGSIEKIQEDWKILSQLKISSKVASLLAEFGVSFFAPAPNEVNRLIENFKKYSLEEVDPVLDLSRGTAYAIYLGEEDGFLTPKSFYASASISAVRTFESAEAARRTIRSQNLNDSVIVELSIELKALVEDSASPEGMDKIKMALALAEKRSLKKALTTAEVESQLEELKQIKLDHPEWFANQAKNLNKSPKPRL